MGKNTVIIIGGGASGLIAAISAANSGAKVTIIERLKRLGKKKLETGNGICNYTNLNTSVKYYHGKSPDYCGNVFAKFGVNDTIDFFKGLGIIPRIEREGYVYPFSNQATSILDVLRYEIDRLGIITICDQEVINIEKSNNQFKVFTNSNKYYASKVILCCGGKSYPNLGSNGSGFELAKKLGHTINKPLPGLVQLKVAESFMKQLKGVRVEAKATLTNNSEIISEEIGEIQFTENGLSGILIFQLSNYISVLLNDNNKPIIHIDLVPNCSQSELNELLLDRFKKMPYKTLSEGLVGFFNKKIIPILIKLSNCNSEKKISNISKEERLRIMHSIKNMEFNITDTMNWEQSQVTLGGISTNEINSNTMESKIIDGLFFAGEIIDIAGDCGGFNLQWAWSSGYLAGKQNI